MHEPRPDTYHTKYRAGGGALVAVRAVEVISFGYQVRTLARRIDRAMAQRMAPYRITLPQYYILRELFREEGITQRELSTRLDATEPGTLLTLRRMEDRGLLRRVRDPADRRKFGVYLTAKGKRLRVALQEHARDVNRLARRGLDESDIARFRAMLDRMEKNLAPAEDFR